MAYKKLRSIKGRRMRLTRLDECGAPDSTNPCSVIVTDGFISVTLGNEVEAGEEYTQKNAWGDFCIAEKDGDRVKWVNVAISMCEIDPAVLDMVGGANPVISGADTIGATFGTEPNPSAFAIEVWTKKAGTDACSAVGNQEWGYFVVPYVRNGVLDGDVTIENGPLAIGLKGEGVQATSDWGSGPHGDTPMKGLFPAGDLYGIVITDVQPPEPTVGCEQIGLVGRSYAGPGMTFTADPQITASNVTSAALLAGEGFVASPLTAWTGTQHITIGTWEFYWNGTAWRPGRAERAASTPGKVFTADADITASDAPNAAKLAGEGFIASPLTAWTTGQKITIGTFDFNWSGSAWAAGAHA